MLNKSVTKLFLNRPHQSSHVENNAFSALWHINSNLLASQGRMEHKFYQWPLTLLYMILTKQHLYHLRLLIDPST